MGKLKAVTFTAKTREKRGNRKIVEVEVTGWEVTGVEGLVIHRNISEHPRLNMNGWRISHAPSGKLVTSRNHRTRAEAIEKVEKLVGVDVDWVELDWENNQVLQEALGKLTRAWWMGGAG